MPRINSRSKGASGERELCEWLMIAFNLSEKPQRNLEQVRSGGADIILNPFAFECKRVEKLDLPSWWAQVNRAVSDKDDVAFGLEPVVAYRQNKQNWNFLITAKNIGLSGVHFIQLSPAVFKKWVWQYIDNLSHGHQIGSDIKRISK